MLVMMKMSKMRLENFDRPALIRYSHINETYIIINPLRRIFFYLIDFSLTTVTTLACRTLKSKPE